MAKNLHFIEIKYMTLDRVKISSLYWSQDTAIIKLKRQGEISKFEQARNLLQAAGFNIVGYGNNTKNDTFLVASSTFDIVKPLQRQYKNLLSENPFKKLKATADKPNVKPPRKTMLSANYKKPAYNVSTSGMYEFKTPKQTYYIESFNFERFNNTQDALEIQNELRKILGSILIKNNAWNKLSKGQTITAQSSTGIKGKLKKLK